MRGCAFPRHYSAWGAYFTHIVFPWSFLLRDDSNIGGDLEIIGAKKELNSVRQSNEN